MKKLNLEMLRLSTRRSLGKKPDEEDYWGVWGYFITIIVRVKEALGLGMEITVPLMGALDSISNWCASGYGTCLYGNYQI